MKLFQLFTLMSCLTSVALNANAGNPIYRYERAEELGHQLVRIYNPVIDYGDGQVVRIQAGGFSGDQCSNFGFHQLNRDIFDRTDGFANQAVASLVSFGEVGTYSISPSGALYSCVAGCDSTDRGDLFRPRREIMSMVCGLNPAHGTSRPVFSSVQEVSRNSRAIVYELNDPYVLWEYPGGKSKVFFEYRTIGRFNNLDSVCSSLGYSRYREPTFGSNFSLSTVAPRGGRQFQALHGHSDDFSTSDGMVSVYLARDFFIRQSGNATYVQVDRTQSERASNEYPTEVLKTIRCERDLNPQ